ncbi:hypothetical protein EB796_014385 [Bugula neritina]|uniref:Uncharacterized protein n=1 Tax=Bugula neritina TaxID=10212 RepID=A0A7J7JNS6_BUGNE|nr:hypothetical protein EB796_014385 [Bugula neritina]
MSIGKCSPLSNWHWGTCFSKRHEYGYTWHAGDHPLDKLSQESQGILHHQTGTGEHASQKGMSIGKVRMAADTPTDEMAMESQGFSTLKLALGNMLLKRHEYGLYLACW